MSEVNWFNVVSAVATEEGLLVTERGEDGTVGALPKLLKATQMGQKPAPQLGKLGWWHIDLQLVGTLPPNTATLGQFGSWITTQTAALNAAQDLEANLGYFRRYYCVRLLFQGQGAYPVGNEVVWVGDSCPERHS